MTVCPTCGHAAEHKASKPRSIPAHRRYFALINAYFMHWPETASRQFVNAEELRKFAEMSAGHREVAASLPIVGMKRESALMLVEAAIRAAGNYVVPVIHKDSVVIWKPKSIAFAKLGHVEACKLFEQVAIVLEQESGLKASQVLRETEHAA